MYHANSFEDHYRTRDGQRLFFFRFHRDGGSSAWKFAVKYGDQAITHSPSMFHNPGLVLHAKSPEELLVEASRWAESVHALYPSKQRSEEEGSKEMEQADGHR